jgi:hypothetical protein
MAKQIPNVPYPIAITVEASAASGMRPSSSAVVAVALASAHPGQPYWARPKIAYVVPQNAGPGRVRMKPVMIGSPVYSV